MTVEQLIAILQTKDPGAQVILHFKRYTPVRTRSRTLQPVNHPLATVWSPQDERKVYLSADQKGDYY